MKLINLKQFRKERGLTQTEFGKALKLPQSTVSYLENGLQEVSDYLIEQIKKAYNVDSLSKYLYERSCFHDRDAIVASLSDSNVSFLEDDWNEVAPIEFIENIPIICRIGAIYIGMDGSIAIDPNNGIGYKLNHYIIQSVCLDSTDIISRLLSKNWFDDLMYEDFKRAYLIACKLADIIPVKQEKPE